MIRYLRYETKTNLVSNVFVLYSGIPERAFILTLKLEVNK